MAGSLSDVESPEVAPHWRATQARRKVLRRVRITALAVLAVAVITLAWDLYNRPAHSYQVGANSATWSADISVALAKLPSGGNYQPVGEFGALPGVGRIFEVVVDQGP